MNFLYMYIGSILCVIAITLMIVMEYSIVGWFILMVGFYFCIKGRNNRDNK